jgi:hypothetical protein
MNMTKKQKQELREIAENSTKVNSWTPHSEYNGYHPGKASVRGPFFRWFIVQGGEGYEKNVANLFDDAKFAAAAMNNLVPLLDRVDKLTEALEFAHKHLESMDNYSVVSGSRHVIEKALAESEK